MRLRSTHLLVPHLGSAKVSARLVTRPHGAPAAFSVSIQCAVVSRISHASIRLVDRGAVCDPQVVGSEARVGAQLGGAERMNAVLADPDLYARDRARFGATTEALAVAANGLAAGGGRHDLADDQPIEHHAHGRELLLDRRRRDLGLQLLYIGGDIMGPDRGGHQAAAVLAPAKEPVAGPSVCPARVRVADVRGEEFDVAPGSFVAEIGDQRRLARRCAPSRAINEAGEWNVLS